MFSWVNRSALVLISALTLCVGAYACSGDTDGEGEQEQAAAEPAGPNTPTASSSQTTSSTSTAGEEPENTAPRTSKKDEKRKNLTTVFVDAYCAQRNNAVGDRMEIYTKHGFKDPADWSKQYHKEAKQNVEWAEANLEEAMKSSCK